MIVIAEDFWDQTLKPNVSVRTAISRERGLKLHFVPSLTVVLTLAIDNMSLTVNL